MIVRVVSCVLLLGFGLFFCVVTLFNEQSRWGHVVLGVTCLVCGSFLASLNWFQDESVRWKADRRTPSA